MGAMPGRQEAGAERGTLSPRAGWALGLTCALIGGVVLARSILADDGGVDAPRWVAATAGAAFVLGGLAVVKVCALDHGIERADDPWSQLFGCLISSCLAAMAAWVAFGSGERRFRVTGSFLLEWVRSGSSEWLGRAAFGLGAVFVGVLALVFGGRLVWRLRRRPAREMVQVLLGLAVAVAAGLAVLHATGDLRLWPGAWGLRHALAAPGLTDAERLELVFRAKLANPAYVRWRRLDAYRQPYQTFEEEALLKEIRSRIAATLAPPAGIDVTTIPVLTGRLPVIDGKLEPQEWAAARRLDLGKGTQLYALSDGRRLYLACDVPADTTAEGFDQLRFYYHVGLAGVIVNERIHVSRGGRDAFASYRLARVRRLDDPALVSVSETQIYQRGRGASTMIAHRQFEAMLDLDESGLHPGVPFEAFVEVETDPLTDAGGRFKSRQSAGQLGSQAAPVWLMIEPGRAE